MRKIEQQIKEEYRLPLLFRPKLDMFMVAMAILALLCGLTLVVTTPKVFTSFDFNIIYFSILGFYLVYFVEFLVNGRMLKKQCLELTTSGLRYRTLFRDRTLLWKEIRSIKQVLGFRNPSYIEVYGRKLDDPDVTIKINRLKYSYVSTDSLIRTWKINAALAE
jgi:hypothetical protein